MNQVQAFTLSKGDTFVYTKYLYRIISVPSSAGDDLLVVGIARKVDDKWVRFADPHEQNFNCYAYVQKVKVIETLTVQPID